MPTSNKRRQQNFGLKAETRQDHPEETADIEGGHHNAGALLVHDDNSNSSQCEVMVVHHSASEVAVGDSPNTSTIENSHHESLGQSKKQDKGKGEEMRR